MKKIRIELRNPEEADFAEGKRCTELCFKINRTMPMTMEYDRLIAELFCNNIGESSRVMPPVTVVRDAVSK